MHVPLQQWTRDRAHGVRHICKMGSEHQNEPKNAQEPARGLMPCDNSGLAVQNQLPGILDRPLNLAIVLNLFLSLAAVALECFVGTPCSGHMSCLLASHHAPRRLLSNAHSSEAPKLRSSRSQTGDGCSAVTVHVRLDHQVLATSRNTVEVYTRYSELVLSTATGPSDNSL